MKEILGNFENPNWWFNSIFVTILISLFTSYIFKRYNSNSTNDAQISICAFQNGLINRSRILIVNIAFNFIRIYCITMLILLLIDSSIGYYNNYANYSNLKLFLSFGIIIVMIVGIVSNVMHLLLETNIGINTKHFVWMKYFFNSFIIFFSVACTIKLSNIYSSDLNEFQLTLFTISISLLLLQIINDHWNAQNSFISRCFSYAAILILIAFVGLNINRSINKKPSPVSLRYYKTYGAYKRIKNYDVYDEFFKFEIINRSKDSIQLIRLEEHKDFHFAEATTFYNDTSKSEKTNLVYLFCVQSETINELIKNPNSVLSSLPSFVFDKFPKFNYFIQPNKAIEINLGFLIYVTKNRRRYFDKLTLYFDFVFSDSTRIPFYTYYDFRNFP